MRIVFSAPNGLFVRHLCFPCETREGNQYAFEGRSGVNAFVDSQADRCKNCSQESLFSIFRYNEANGPWPPFWLRRGNQFLNFLNQFNQYLIMIADTPFQLFDFSCYRLVHQGQLTKTNECPDDKNAHFVRLFRIQHIRSLQGAVFCKHQRKFSPTAPIRT